MTGLQWIRKLAVQHFAPHPNAKKGCLALKPRGDVTSSPKGVSVAPQKAPISSKTDKNESIQISGCVRITQK